MSSYISNHFSTCGCVCVSSCPRVFLIINSNLFYSGCVCLPTAYYIAEAHTADTHSQNHMCVCVCASCRSHMLIGRDVEHSEVSDTIQRYKKINTYNLYMCNIVQVERVIPGALDSARLRLRQRPNNKHIRADT